MSQKNNSNSPFNKQTEPILYNGKTVWTEETFDYGEVQAGDYVDQTVVDNAMNCLPPVCMSSNCSQMGMPYSHRQDPETGEWRATYSTFKWVSGQWPNAIWEYCGHCFQSENTERKEAVI
ncbi:hypothetical protein [Anaerotruncus rubiinfantis]|uniref:hypothetical protein n=1 Tax=Anaerotruncus rubiinfantis TaxID=1720200 RepID=UPI003D7AEE53